MLKQIAIIKFVLLLLASVPLAHAHDFATAEDVRTSEAYHAKVKPGYCCWVSLWRDSQDAVYLSFVEKRRAPNLSWEPVPLAFWESMGLPDGYHTALSNGAKDIVYEIVVLKSADQGETWQEIGRGPSKVDNTFSWVTLSDGSLLRSQSNDYIAWHEGDRQHTWCETSTDGGKTWEQRSVIFYGHNGSGSPHRLRRLRDGTLVQLISAMPEFGPGKERFMRHTKRPNVRQELAVFLYFSKDEGRSWSGPLPVLPGIMAAEPDFIELPSGDLLLLNSTVQGGPPVRQYVRKTELGWIPGPVFDVVSGGVPETVASVSGVLVGAVRGGKFTCSNDDGANWYPIAGIPNAQYQPYIIALPDDRLLCAMHVGGGDEPFGRHDIYVATTSFKLKADLPQPTRLTLTRNLSSNSDRYINSYTATLTSGNRPLPDQKVKFRYKKSDSQENELTFVTDGKGRATLDLTGEFQDVAKLSHVSYKVQASFTPDSNDKRLAPCESDEYTAYAITTSKADLGHDSQ